MTDHHQRYSVPLYKLTPATSHVTRRYQRQLACNDSNVLRNNSCNAEKILAMLMSIRSGVGVKQDWILFDSYSSQLELSVFAAATTIIELDRDEVVDDRNDEYNINVIAMRNGYENYLAFKGMLLKSKLLTKSDIREVCIL